MDKSLLIKWITELQAIAQTGLHYCKNIYDIERYEQLYRLTVQMAEACSELAGEDIEARFAMQSGYATPKIDVRGFVVKDDKILLVREIQDGFWTLPGGWCETTLSPSENVIKEFKEESGFDVKVIRLLALWDKLKHDHPPQWPHAYKIYFHCEITGGEASVSSETSGVEWFAIDKLPTLSTPRVTASQLQKLYRAVKEGLPVAFD